VIRTGPTLVTKPAIGRQVGSSLGVAVTGSVLAAGLPGPIATGFTAATRPAWWMVTAIGGAAAA